MKLKSDILEGAPSYCSLKDAPAVLSIGGRSKLGYSYVLIAGHGQCCVLPSGKILPLSQDREVPYLSSDDHHTDPTINPAQISGLTVKDGVASFSIYGKELVKRLYLLLVPRKRLFHLKLPIHAAVLEVAPLPVREQ